MKSNHIRYNFLTVLVEINEPQCANGLFNSPIQYFLEKTCHFASTNDPIPLIDVSLICDTTARAFQEFRNLEAYRPSERYEIALSDAEEDFLYLYKYLFEIKWPGKDR